MVGGEVHDVELVVGAGGLRGDQQGRGGLGGVAGDLAAEDRTVLEVHVDYAQPHARHVRKVAVEVEGVSRPVVARLISIRGVEEEQPIWVAARVLVRMKPFGLDSSWATAQLSSKNSRTTDFLIFKSH